jgi:outer membrane cobalamin receptor
VKIFAIADWVRTQVKNNCETVAQHQIFIPDFMGNIGFLHIVDKATWGFDIQHVGNRYIQTDNQQWLAGYRLVNAQIGLNQVHLHTNKNHSEVKMNVLFECKNLFNNFYQSMPNRVMPGRTVCMSLSINI